jgi:hypothetical protein
MIRRIWGSRHFANVVALMALVAALGGNAIGAPKFIGNDSTDDIASKKQLNALLAGMLDSFKQDGGLIKSEMIDDATLTSKDLKPKTINGGDIKNQAINGALVKPNTITNAAINEQAITGIEKCTGGLLGPFGDVCTTPLRTAGTWDQAELDCFGDGLRLPTITEGLQALSSFTAEQEIWTDEVYGEDGDFRVAMRRQAAVDGGGIVLEHHVHTDSVQYRCVIKSSSST